MDSRNRFPTNDIKWIIAQRRKGGTWQIRYIGNGANGIPSLDHVLDNTQIGDIKDSEFGVFKNRENWWEYRPRRYYCGFEVKINLHACCGGLINSRGSDWF